MQRAQLHSGTLTPVLAQVVIPIHLSASREAECRCGRGGKTAPPPVPARWDTARMAERETADVTAPAEAGAAGPGERGKTPAEATANVRVAAPTRGNRKLEALLSGLDADQEVRAWWHMAQVNSERLGMSDHSWVHVQIV